MFISTADVRSGEAGKRGEAVFRAGGGESAEDRLPSPDRHRTCFLMSQLITFTPEWEKSREETGTVNPGWSRGNFYVVPDKRHSFHTETRVVLTVDLPCWVRFDMVSTRKALIQASATTFIFRPFCRFSS